MKFSIITPSFNQAAYLPRTMQSILGQQGDFDLQWIIVDGGSTDGTVDLLRAIDDPRLRWISEPDRGQSHALNKGFGLADGEVIGWLNSDDLYAPGALAAVAAGLSAHPGAAWVVGRCDIINDRDEVIRRAVTRYKDSLLDRFTGRLLLRENPISQPAVFWRSTFGRSVGPIDESLHHAMDYDLWLRMARRCNPLILRRTLAHFRLHAESKSGAEIRSRFAEQYAAAQRYFNGDRASRWIHLLNVEKIVWSYRLMRLAGR